MHFHQGVDSVPRLSPLAVGQGAHVRRGHNTAKNSVMTVVSCTLGKVRKWDTVDDSVRSHMNHKKGNKEFSGTC